MWYAVSPEDKSEMLRNCSKGPLLQKFMLQFALRGSGLNGDTEIKKIVNYCEAKAKRHTSGKCTVRCPDVTCDSEFVSSKGEVYMLSNTLKLHWFTSRKHQAQFHQLSSELCADSREEAQKLYADVSEKIKVIPFPESSLPVVKKAKTESTSNLMAQGNQSRIAPSKMLQSPTLTYFLFEPGDNPGMFLLFMAPSKEKVIEDFLRSKEARNQHVMLDDVKNELVLKTCKQQKVQGDAINVLVCPAQGCNHEHQEKGQQPLLDKIVAALVLHYAAYHKHESPCIKTILDLIATDPATARKNINKGN